MRDEIEDDGDERNDPQRGPTYHEAGIVDSIPSGFQPSRFAPTARNMFDSPHDRKLTAGGRTRCSKWLSTYLTNAIDSPRKRLLLLPQRTICRRPSQVVFATGRDLGIALQAIQRRGGRLAS